MLTPEQYRAAEKDFRTAFDLCKLKLSAESIASVTHYLEHSELEMAYEALGLSIDAEAAVIPEAAKTILHPLAKTLGVLDDGVLCGNFAQRILPLLKPS